MVVWGAICRDNNAEVEFVAAGSIVEITDAMDAETMAMSNGLFSKLIASTFNEPWCPHIMILRPLVYLFRGADLGPRQAGLQPGSWPT